MRGKEKQMSEKYDNYLKEHIGAVKVAAKWMIENNIVPSDEIVNFDNKVHAHDESKFLVEEYDAYDAYFYGERDEYAFDRAWLHHIHNNPHHWQYWLLFEDENKGKPKALEMPKVYVLEMIADWWSFSWRSGNLYEMFKWYDDHKAKIILHPCTQKYLESVLSEIKVKLDES